MLNLTDRAYAALGVALPELTGGEAAYLEPAPGRSVRVGLDLTL